MKKFIILIFFWKFDFSLPPSPSINVGHNLESRSLTDQHWLWGEGFSYFLSLSQILCTWLSEFWLKICYFVESVKSLPLLRGGSNWVWALSKAIKITFRDMNHLTPLWPPGSHGGWPSYENFLLFGSKMTYGVSGTKQFCGTLLTNNIVYHFIKKRRKTDKNWRKTERKLILGSIFDFSG